MASMQRDIRAQTICLLVMLGFLIAGAFYWLRPVLLPFVLAIFISSGLLPILHSIERRFRTPRLVALAIAALLGLFIVFLLWTVMAVSVSQLARNTSKYEARFQELAAIVSEWGPHTLGGRSDADESNDSESDAEDEQPAAEQPATEQPADENPASDDESPEKDESDEDESDDEKEEDPLIADLMLLLPDMAENNSPRDGPRSDSNDQIELADGLTEMLSQGVRFLLMALTRSLVDIMGSGTMVVIFMLFLLLGGSDAIPRSETWTEIDRKMRKYIVSKSLISFFTGLIFGSILWLFGIPLAIVFALLAFLFNFIPNIGPIIASLMPIPLILFDPELSVWGMILVISLTSAVQIISGNVVEPKLMGDSFDMHPIVILLALMFWGMIWGIVGMFLATPITAAMKILFSKFESTKPLANLLAGRIDGITFDFLNVGGEGSSEKKDSDWVD